MWTSEGSSSRRESRSTQRFGFCKKSRGPKMSRTWPSTTPTTATMMPMSWCCGSHVGMRIGVSKRSASLICSTSVTRASLVIITPAGLRVEPEVYCKKQMAPAVSSPSAGATGSHAAAMVSGRESTAKIRGRSRAGRSAKKARTAGAPVELVTTRRAFASASTARRCASWPGSFGSYSGTGTRPAYSAPMNAKRYSAEFGAMMATRSPGCPIWLRRAATALMRVLTSVRVNTRATPSGSSVKSQSRIFTASPPPAARWA